VVGAVVLVQRIGPRAQVYERIVGCATGSVVELRADLDGPGKRGRCRPGAGQNGG
jgi:hypothetical protein